MVELSFLGPDDWKDLRQIRLAALDDAPDAFWSATGDEKSWDEQRWRQTFANGSWLVACIDDEAIGVAKAARGLDDDQFTRHIESVWVAEPHRNRKVARDLLEHLIEHEARTGVREIKIWVIGPNEIAHALYASLGFTRTGESKPLPGPGDVERLEERLLLFP